MRRLWPLVIAAWSANPGRAAAALIAVSLGVGAVLAVTVFHETAHRAMTDQIVTQWLGSAHISIHPPGAHWGTLHATLAEELATIENVQHVTARLHRRFRYIPTRSATTGDSPRETPALFTRTIEVDAIGIDPATESHFRTFPALAGRALAPQDRRKVVIERDVVAPRGLGLGDRITLAAFEGGPQDEFEIIGLFDSNRIAEFQYPTAYLPVDDLRELSGEPGAASVIDLKLHEPSLPALEKAKRNVEEKLAALGLVGGLRVETAAARQSLLAEAERVTRLLIILVACITMLTSFFIILTTQSVSLIQRRAQLGMLRCVGLTRGQLAALLFGELAPLGVVGTICGVALGLTIVTAAGYAGRELFLRMYISSWAVTVSVISGLITTLIGAVFLFAQVARLGPLDAVNTQARPARLLWIYLATALGVGLLVVHTMMVGLAEGTRWLGPAFATFGVGSLYLGYALLAPGLVIWLGRPIAGWIGRLAGLRASLAAGPIVTAPWRSTGACWVLMVGLSLIVYIAVRAEGALDIWNFPSQLPQAFVWSPRYVPGAMIDRVRSLPGVGELSTTADVDCNVQKADEKPPTLGTSLVEKFIRSLSRPVYVAAEPDEIMAMIKVAFVEGDLKDGVAKIKRGGYVFIPPQTSRTKNLHLGDKVNVTIQGTTATFEVAGVIQSPALDIAVTAFQAETYLQFAAASAILGTREDLKQKFGMDVVAMFMFEIRLDEQALPEDFRAESLPDPLDDLAVARALIDWTPHLPEERAVLDPVLPAIQAWHAGNGVAELPGAPAAQCQRFARALTWLNAAYGRKNAPVEEAWDAFRERMVLLRVAYEIDRPDAIMGSLRRLKERMDVAMNRAIQVVTWLPSILLALAAIGIANLMMVSVHQRTRELAMLRAIGAERKHIIGMVLAEAMTLGVLGSIVGVTLGLHEAYSVNAIAANILDVSLRFIVPVGTILAAVGLTLLASLLAGWIPARRAARDSVVAALQTI